MAATLQNLTARAVLFDMDGTIVDSTAVVESIWRQFAERFASWRWPGWRQPG